MGKLIKSETSNYNDFEILINASTKNLLFLYNLHHLDRKEAELSDTENKPESLIIHKLWRMLHATHTGSTCAACDVCELAWVQPSAAAVASPHSTVDGCCLPPFPYPPLVGFGSCCADTTDKVQYVVFHILNSCNKV